MAPSPPLTHFKALSFDIYGTLIDWESGILGALEPLRSQLAPTHACAVSRDVAVDAFMRHEVPVIRANPAVLYGDALQQATRGLAKEWGLQVTEEQVRAVAASVPGWECFADTVDAMRRLGRRYKLIALSNVSRGLFAETTKTTLKDVRWDATYLAEDIGSYKPSHSNFEYLLSHAKADLALDKADILHVGHGVVPDQIPAEEFGMSHAWIERGVNNWGDVQPHEGLRCWRTLGDLADSVDEAFGN